MEFVFSVHPSSSKNTDMRGPQKEGASITHEATAVAAKLLSSVPSSMTPDAWFEGIAGQLFYLIDGDAGKDLAKAAAQIVGYGILGKKQFGAPGKQDQMINSEAMLSFAAGSAGWKVFVQPLLESVNPSLMEKKDTTSMALGKDDEVIDFSRDPVLVSSQRLEQSLQRLKTLVTSTPSPGLCKRLLKPILLQVWALTSWVDPSASVEQKYCRVARELLQTYLRLFGKADSIMPLVNNLLYHGPANDATFFWQYHSTADSIEITIPRGARTDAGGWGAIDVKSTTLADIIISACSKEDISSIFLQLLQGWIQSSSKQTQIKIMEPSAEATLASPEQELATLTFLQKLMDKAPEKLVSQFDQLIDLICQVLKANRSSALEDDIVAVVLSLLNLVITAPEFQKSDIKPEDLETIETSLGILSEGDRGDVSLTARNLAMLLKFRGEFDESEERPSAPSKRQVEDRRTYNLAMEYITGAGDNPPPVVSEGLNLLSGLILAESPILDIPAINVLMSTLLSENEDFINLRVIKIFTQLANKHPKSTVQEILDRYLDAQEKLSTDIRLRFGEALLQVIERLGATFTGEVAQQVSETLLSIAGRRGYRPKTLAKQAREERLRKLKEQKIKKEDVEDPSLDEDGDEDMDEDEKTKNDILGQIIKGWESVRGAEDIRMRTSALSIFGRALEVNIAGIGPTLVSAGVDLCANVLALEPEIEKGILRRAAILVILGFVKALDAARESRQSLGFGLTDTSRQDISQTLQYVAATDNDGLVRQHAVDVVESLENWQMASLMPQQQSAGTVPLTRLAGLQVNPDASLVDASGRPRPRIEEIE
jgi:hypothetical protein